MIRRPGRPVSGDQWRNKYLQQLRVGSDTNASSLVSELTQMTISTGENNSNHHHQQPSSSSSSSAGHQTTTVENTLLLSTATTTENIIPPTLLVTSSSSTVPIPSMNIPSTTGTQQLTPTSTTTSILPKNKSPLDTTTTKPNTHELINKDNKRHHHSTPNDDDDIFGYSMEGVVQSSTGISNKQYGIDGGGVLHRYIDSEEHRHLSNDDSNNNYDDNTTTVSSIDGDQNYNDSTGGLHVSSSSTVYPLPVSIAINNTSSLSIRNNQKDKQQQSTRTTIPLNKGNNNNNLLGTSWQSSSTSTTPTINGRIYMEAQSYDSEDSSILHKQPLSSSSSSSLSYNGTTTTSTMMMINDNNLDILSHSIPEMMAPVYELARLHTKQHNPKDNTHQAVTVTGISIPPTNPPYYTSTLPSSTSLSSDYGNNWEGNAILNHGSLIIPSTDTIPIASPRKVPSSSILHPTVEEEEGEEDD